MTKKPKKHVWSLLTRDEGSWVVDRRKKREIYRNLRSKIRLLPRLVGTDLGDQ